MLSATSIYGLFTVLHDSVHRSVSTVRVVNETVGVLASLAFFPSLAGFQSFRFIHNMHHKHTNDERLDPDIWTHGGVLQWASLDVGYLIWAVRNRSLVPLYLWAEMAGMVTLYGLLLTYAFTFTAYWLVSHRLAVFFLGLFFDYLPHMPFDSKARWQNTIMLRYPMEKLATLALLSQNWHIVHHLWPQVPFYRYQEVFSMQHQNFVEKQARERDMVSWELRKIS